MSASISVLHELRLPPLAESVVEGEVLGWLVAEGDTLQEGQSVLEIMTDKVTVELPSPFSGQLVRVLVQVGEVVAVGTPLAMIAVADSLEKEVARVPDLPAAPTQAPTQEVIKEQPQQERSIIESRTADSEDYALVQAAFAGYSRPSAAAPAGRVRAVPSARQLAREYGVHLTEVRGSGKNGTVRRADVEAHLQPAAAAPPSPQAAGAGRGPSWPPPAPPAYRTPARSEHLETRTPFRGTRRAISQALLASTLYTAQTHTIEELDCSALMAQRRELGPDAEQAGVKLSYLPFFLKAVAVALRAFPALNSSLDTQTNEVVSKRFVHVGVAVNTDAGLIVPVIRDVAQKSLLALAAEVSDLSARARLGTLKPHETQDATFTVSNIGAVGALVGFPIVSPPAVGILSLHSIVKRPVAAEIGGEDVVVVRPMMYLTLGFDHRLVDGADAARFNRRVVTLLEEPRRLYLEM